MKRFVVAGADPGKNGSIVIAEFEECDGRAKFRKIVATHRLCNVGQLLNDFCAAYNGIESVWCEQVQSFGGSAHGRRQGAKSMFTFATGYGRVHQALSLMETDTVKINDVKPKKWQETYGLYGLGLGITDKKNKHKECVLERFRLSLVHAEVDAFLICAYGANQYVASNRTRRHKGKTAELSD